MIRRHLTIFTALFVIVFVFALPLGSLYFVSSTSSYLQLADSIAQMIFINKHDSIYLPFFSFVVQVFLAAFIFALSICLCLIIGILFPGGKYRQHLTKKQKIRQTTIMCIAVFVFAYSIPISHLPEIAKDYNLVKRNITQKIVSTNYITYVRKEVRGRFNTNRDIYYVRFNRDERNQKQRSFSIGRDFYEYLLVHSKEQITVNYMPNTGIFLNIEVGDEKFGTFPEDESQ